MTSTSQSKTDSLLPTVALASDHAGYPLKEELKKHLESEGYTVTDLGTDGPASVDYPVFADRLCAAVTGGLCRLGILVCGTGIGMSIAANKHPGIRAACCSDSFSARLTRMHNDANVLCLGARVVGTGLAAELADLFLSTPFEGGRHTARVEMLNALDEKKTKGDA